MIFMVWLLTCTGVGSARECSTFQLYQTVNWRDCWDKVELYRQVLSDGPSKDYRLWCAGPDKMEIQK